MHRHFTELRALLFRTHVVDEKAKPEVLETLERNAHMEMNALIVSLSSTDEGLTTRVASERLHTQGANVIVRERRKHWSVRLAKIFFNPLSLLLLGLAGVSWATQDVSTAIVIGSMTLLATFIRFFQENQAYSSAEALKRMVHTTCTVDRDGKPLEVRLEEVVPGDVLDLAAGDIVPADARIIVSKDLSINQSLLTGEALPVEKHAALQADAEKGTPLDYQNMCFMGSNVQSGTAKAIIVATGSKTYFGSLAKDIVGQREVTDFDRGIAKFTWLMIAFMAVMVPFVFLANGFGKHNWLEAFTFAVSVAVGLTPEMLPALVAVNLTKGSVQMAKKRVIVKRLSSIQNFGAMNVLCSDKTGTLTQNKVSLIKNIDLDGETDDETFEAAYINSSFQTGYRNLMDGAVLAHGKSREVEHVIDGFKKIDELPFDFQRRRLSVIAENAAGEHWLFCKGAAEEVITLCSGYTHQGVTSPIDDVARAKIASVEQELALEGFQVIVVAKRRIDDHRASYSVADEKDMTLLGFMAFLDPPKESAKDAIALLKTYGVDVKVLTGDNELVTKKVCREVGLRDDALLMGGDIEKMTDEQLREKVVDTIIFAKLLPEHKRRVVLALQVRGCVVGFMGDGINDAPALRTADVGISVDSAVDIAKESADIILLEMSLSVLGDGVAEGRRVFGNIIKYIKMGASSNFGNMFSVLGASLLFPFVPMLPLQILTNNLLYDMSQTTIPTDTVDPEYIEKPRKWSMPHLARYILFIGPISSIFDYATFFAMWYLFGVRLHATDPHYAAMFQTAWFVESLLTQTLIIHVIRSRKVPFVQTWASRPLLVSTAIIMATGIGLVVSPLGKFFKFVPLPHAFWPLLVAYLVAYVLITQVVKTWFIRRYGND